MISRIAYYGDASYHIIRVRVSSTASVTVCLDHTAIDHITMQVMVGCGAIDSPATNET